MSNPQRASLRCLLAGQPNPGRWRKILSALLSTLSLSVCLGLAQSVWAGPDLNQYELAFGDEFNGTELDSSKWNTGLLWGPYLPINNEEQLYVDTLGMHQDFEYSPFEMTGTSLKIVATPTSAQLQPPARPAEDDPVWDNFAEYRFNGPTSNGPGYQPSDVNYLSGIITSYDSFRFTHGYIETRMKLPAGKGLWPAFWANTSFYVEDVPEIDVVEFLGDQTDRVYHTYHYFQPQNNWQLISTPSYTTLGDDFTQDWHVFGMQWGPTEIIWYVDGVETRRIDSSEYDIANQAMYLLANLAVGGNWPGAPDADTLFPAELEIDYIRAYQRKPVDVITPAALASEFQLVFEDTFSGNAVDASKWNSSFLWGPYRNINNEEQLYPDMLGEHQGYDINPLGVSNGLLSITATAVEESQLPEPQSEDSTQFTNNPTWRRNTGYRDPESPDYYVPGYVSGLLTSYESFKFVNGYAEVRARLPAGSGLWPAFWLLNGYYVDQQPEIDVMEFRGETPGEIVHSYHYYNSEGLQSESYVTPGADYSADFHTYGVHWQPGKIDWYVDGNLVQSTSGEKVSSQVMYLILNLAVGGNFVAEVDDTALPATYEVDYVRVWQRTIADDAAPANIAPVAADDSAGPVEAGESLSVSVLDNDTDSDGIIDAATLTITQQPAEGTASVSANGQIQYEHAGGTSSGTDTLRYTVDDDDGETSNEAVVTIAISDSRDTNIAPVAQNDTAGPLEAGQSITVAVLANDIDEDGTLQAETVTIVTQPATGTAVVESDGQITYTHSGTTGTGSDSLTYTVQDESGATSNAATLSISPINDPVEPSEPALIDPVPGTQLSGSDVTFSWSANGQQVQQWFLRIGRSDGSTEFAEVRFRNPSITQYRVTGLPTNGVPVFVRFYYFQDGRWNTQRIQYQAADTSGINQPPVAMNDAIGPLTVGQSATVNVLANDTDPDGTLDPASVTIVTPPANGTATARADGRITYTHTGSSAIEADTLTYTVSDNRGATSNEATLTIAPINEPDPDNAAPQAVDDTVGPITAGQSVTVDVLANDTDSDGNLNPASVSIVAQPASGTAAVLANGQIRYTHGGAAGTGSDSLTYTVEDEDGATSNTASLSISPINDPAEPSLPTLVDPSPGATLAGSDVTFNWSANGQSVQQWFLRIGRSEGSTEFAQVRFRNASTTQYRVTGLPTNGVPVFVEFSFFQDGRWSTRNFQFQAADTGGVNQPPMAVNDTIGPLIVGQSATVNVLANDSDSDGTLDVASVSIVTPPTNGTATARADGRITYTHTGSSALDADTLTYTVNDNRGASSNEATLTISPINEPDLTNTPPQALDDTAGPINAGQSVTVNVLANDTDSDGTLNPASVRLVAQPDSGTAVVLANGQISYTHTGAAGTASDSLAYTVQDDDGATSNAATLTISPINDPVEPSQPGLIDPLPGTRLSGSDVTFNWSANGQPVQQWFLRIGRSDGPTEFAQVRFRNPSTTQYRVTGLPTNGVPVYVQFSYYQAGRWNTQRIQFQAADTSAVN